jgi:transposase
MLSAREAIFLSQVQPIKYSMMEQIYIGIDVAKDSLVVATRLEGKVITSLHNNDRKGINSFLKNLPAHSWCIMEATGVYSLRLAIALYENGIKVSVVNPLQTERFAQAKLKRSKTDKVDAALIAEYGERMQPKLYEPPLLCANCSNSACP